MKKIEEVKKPKRKKMDDSKNGDYFNFCRNKKCNEPIYKNRSQFDTRYCDVCLQEGKMEEYIVVQVWNNIGDMTFKTTHKTKENAISVMKKFQEINDIENGDKTFEIFTKVKI